MDSNLYDFSRLIKDFSLNGKTNEVNALLKDFSNIINNQNTSRDTIDYLLRKIFSSEYNLFNFIGDNIKKKEWKITISVTFQILDDLLKKYSSNVRPYYSTILQECTKLSLSGISTNEKDKTISIVCVVLKDGSTCIPADDIYDIFNSFYNILKTCGKEYPATVLKNIFILLGIIAKYYNSVIYNEKEVVYNFIRIMDMTNICDTGSNLKIYGAFEGLTNILSEYPYLYKEDNDICFKLYKNIKKFTDYNVIKDKNRKNDCRAAIKFIVNHPYILSNCIKPNEFNWWHKGFKEMYSSYGENRKVGLEALLMFYRELAEIFKTNGSEEYNKSFEELYKNFIENLRAFEGNTSNDDQEIRLSLHGISYFVAAFKAQNKQNELNSLLIYIVMIMQQFYLQDEVISERVIEYLPDFLKCYSIILNEIDVTTDEQILTLQRLTITVLKSYPKISTLYHALVFAALAVTFENLYNKDTKIFERFIRSFVEPSLIWTCYKRNWSEEDDINKNVTYKAYLRLWKDLINIESYSYDNVDTTKYVVHTIFDEMMKNLFTFTMKLNLGMRLKSGNEIALTDLESAYEPINPDDYVIFLNVVDFYTNIFAFMNKNLFKKWIRRYIKHFVSKSTNDPVISGYYKLLSSCMKTSVEIKYFDDVDTKEGRQEIFQTMLKYLEDVVVKTRLYKGDLQLSCVELILKSPIYFVKPLLPVISDPLIVAFSVGQTFTKIAELGIETLEYWYKHLSPEDLKPLFQVVLPHLDAFLRSEVRECQIDIREFKLRNNRVLKVETESELFKLQRKVIEFIARLDPESNQHLIELNFQNEMPWDVRPDLKFVLPFEDTKLIIYLDKLIPRLIELVESSSNRKTRIGAAEVLHGIFIILLGLIRQMSTKKYSQYEKLHEILMTTTLRLASDSDRCIRDLFNVFVFQIIHWYTSPAMLQHAELSRVLVDILMEGVSHEMNTALRDFSGKCINEFIKWSIIQYDKNNASNVYTNVEKVVRKICLFCLNPNFHKRYGAAIAFNHVYVTLREEETMVDIFWIELMYSFIMNLSLNEGNENDQIYSALTHIERVLKEKHELFNRPRKGRLIPSPIRGSLLKDTLIWILQKTADENCRTKCMELFMNLYSCVPNCTEPKDFIINYMEPNWFEKIYKKDTVNNLTDLLCFIEGFGWIIEQKLLPSVTGVDLYERMMKIISSDRNSEDMEIDDEQSVLTLFTIRLREILTVSSKDDRINSIKKKIVQKLFFLEMQLCRMDKSHCNSAIWDLLCISLYEPNVIGYDTIDKRSVDQHKMDYIDVLNKFNECLSPEGLKVMYVKLSRYFSENYNEKQSFKEINVSSVQRSLLKGLLIIQSSALKDKCINLLKYFSRSVSNVFESLYENDSYVYLNGVAIEYMKLHLELSLSLKNSLSELWECITNKNVYNDYDTGRPIQHGSYFYKLFNDVILNYLVMNLPKVVENYFKLKNVLSDNDGGEILLDVLKYMSENRRLLTGISFPELINNVMEASKCYFVYKKDITFKQREMQIDFLRYIARLSTNAFITSDHLRNWFILTLLWYDRNDPNNLLFFKLKLLYVLPCFTGPNEEFNKPFLSTLREYLEQTINHIKHCTKYSSSNLLLFNFFNRMLDTMCISKSQLVLRCTLELYASIPHENVTLQLNENIKQYYHKLNIEEQYKSLIVLNETLEDKKYDLQKRYDLAKMFVRPMLKYCEYGAFEKFYVHYIRQINNNLEIKIETHVKSEFILIKTISFIFVEMLFSRIDIQKLRDCTCPVSIKLFGNDLTENALLKKFTKFCLEVRKEILETEDEIVRSLYCSYQCCALNAFISTISNTKKDPSDLRTYEYIFKENEAKNEFVWKRIIDCTKSIAFPETFELVPEKISMMSNIRKSRQNENVMYIKSQNIFNSSLSEDITRYDFSNTLLRNETIDRTDDLDGSYHEIISERLDLNEHECMPTVCGLIQHLIDHNISPLPENESAPLPYWLETIKRTLLNSLTEKNVKIFFSRVIHNMEHIFCHYSKHFYIPIIKSITDGCYGDSLNFFTGDLLTMLTKWPDSPVLTNDKNTVANLVYFLVDKAHSDRKDILRFNLELIKTVVDVWKDYVTVPVSLLVEKLKKKDFTSVQLVAIFLANGLLVWNRSNVNEYLLALASIIQKDKNYSDVQRSTSEVVGMTLRIMSEKTEWNKEFVLLEQQVQTILTKCEEDTKMLHCLEHIQIHYPKIVEAYAKEMYTKLSYNLKNSALVTICLKNILRYMEATNESFRFPVDYVSLLNNNENDVVLLTLRLISKNISQIENVSNLITTVIKYYNSSNGEIRSAMYDVLISFCTANISIDSEVLSSLQSTLLLGLVDTNDHVQEKIYLFWSEQLPTKLYELCPILLSKLYSSESEDYYLGYCVYFLLDACKYSGDYQQELYEHPLSDCKYEEQQLDVSWRRQHDLMTPLFSDIFLTPNKPKFYGVRLDTNKMFSPTQATKSLTQSVSSFLFPTIGTLTTSEFDIDTKIETVVHKNYKTKTYVKHNRRFLSSRGKISKFFAKIETERKTTSFSRIQDQIKNRDLNVSVCRKYQKGDFPDVQVPRSDIIKTLQNLVKTDRIIARLLFGMIYETSIKEFSGDGNEFINSINTHTTKILIETIIYEQNLMGAILDLYVKVPKMLIDMDLVSNVGKQSGLLTTASLLLEQIVSASDDDSIQVKISYNLPRVSTDDKWMKLAQFYKNMNKHDGAVGIYSSKINSTYQYDILKTIRDETIGKWKSAAESYKRLIDIDPGYLDFYQDAFLKCHAHLSDWKTIHEYTSLNINETNRRQQLIIWFIFSTLNLTLETNKSSAKALLRNVFDEWLADPNKSEYVKNYFSESLSMWSLYQNDVQSVKYYSNCYVVNFLNEWNGTSPLLMKNRLKQLINLNTMNETMMYINNRNNIDGLIDEWEKNNNFDSSYFIETQTRYIYRKYLINNLLSNMNDERCSRLLIETSFKFIEYALKNRNYYVAEKYINKVRNVTPGEGVDGVRFTVLKCRAILLKHENLENGESKLKDSIKWLSHLNDTVQKNDDNESLIQVMQLIHKFTVNIDRIITNDPDVLSTNRSSLNNVINGDIKKYAIDVLRKAVELGEKDLMNVETPYVQLFLYLKTLNDRQYDEEILKSCLRAMKFGSIKARRSFPYLLQILDGNKQLGSLFKTESSVVPTWMFLSWIPQIMGLLDTLSTVVEDILINLASEYPQAIVFPFLLSKSNQISNDTGKTTIEKLNRILDNDTYQKFIFSISCVCVPEINFKYHMEKLINSLNNKQSFIKAVQDFRNDMLRKSNEYPAVSGKYFYMFKDLMEAYNKLLVRTLDDFDTNDPDRLRSELNDSRTFEQIITAKRSCSLLDYSVWLAKYQSAENSVDIEIPGQYSGERKPLPERHVKISSFSDTVYIYEKSIRKPVKLTMIGNDAKPYEFLVKFGEDLRQDQRIQQLFTTMNAILLDDENCKERNLFLETYCVVPIHNYFGLIRCVGTKTLSNFIFPDGNKYGDASNEYLKWIESARIVKPLDVRKRNCQYWNATAAYDRDQTIAKYKELSNFIPNDILRNSLSSVCIDMEHYFLLRERFMTSYSVMCIAHWILGIGDRHLENIMVNRHTGRVIGVDFGYAFEVTTRNLSVPELVPFRFTPHIVALAEPLYETGPIERSMVNVLQALRNNKDILLSMMDVFVKEPCVGWLETAQNKAERHDRDFSGDFIPDEKISNAEKKLNGCNPVFITINELRRGSLKNESIYLKAYEEAAFGNFQFNIRRRLPETDLTPEQQVECLLDQAMDPNILGRMFVGFQPWV